MVGKTCHKSTETFSNWNIKDYTCEKDNSYLSLREWSTPLLSLPQMYLRARDIRVVVAQAKKEISCYSSVFRHTRSTIEKRSTPFPFIIFTFPETI